jgi:hypothetical protein
VDPAAPEILVVRAPVIPEGVDAKHCLFSTEAHLELPAEVEVEIRVSGAGHLFARGRNAPLNLSTKRGDLSIRDCRGPARLQTGTGQTLVSNHSGDLYVNSRGGEINATLAAAGTELRLLTGSGNIVCLVPADTGFRLSARTLQGRVQAPEFGITGERGPDYSASMTGSAGDGRTSIVLNTGVGNVSLAVRKVL